MTNDMVLCFGCGICVSKMHINGRIRRQKEIFKFGEEISEKKINRTFKCSRIDLLHH